MDWLHVLLLVFGPVAGWLAHRLYMKLAFKGKWKIKGKVRLRKPDEEFELQSTELAAPPPLAPRAPS